MKGEKIFTVDAFVAAIPVATVELRAFSSIEALHLAADRLLESSSCPVRGMLGDALKGIGTLKVTAVRDPRDEDEAYEGSLIRHTELGAVREVLTK